MAPADRNDLTTSQEKLEWVTPKISLMGAEETEGKFPGQVESTRVGYLPIGLSRPPQHNPSIHHQTPIVPTGSAGPFLLDLSSHYLAPMVGLRGGCWCA